jgi:hypothetical protein
MKSQKQRAYLWATDPKLARKFEDHTPKGKKLPKKLHPEKTVKRTQKKACISPGIYI